MRTAIVFWRKGKTMDDLISRHVAIDDIKRDRDASVMPWVWYDGVNFAINHLINMSSVQPVPICAAKVTLTDEQVKEAFEKAKCEILAALPSAQSEIIRCRKCKFASGDSRICMKFGHSPIGELDFCAWAERKEE